MFAGLPGIGVGTLYYILVALWMPVRELVPLVRGTSTVARWRLIVTELFYAIGIIASIAVADRLLSWSLGLTTSTSVGPARWIHDKFKVDAPSSILAAPIAASIVLLAGVLLFVQLLRWYAHASGRRTRTVPVTGRSLAGHPSTSPAGPAGTDYGAAA